MKEQFVEHRFSSESADMIQTIEGILEEYRAQGFRLSLRQLYYQLVARDLIPNTVRSYKNTGTLVSNARQAGLLDWSMIEDRGRDTVIPSHWESPADILDSAASSFRVNKWEKQPWHMEVMVEKDALSGVLEPVCRDLDIGITANKGYSSSSTMYDIGKRIRRAAVRGGKHICVIYLGDHDPSGIDMTRDVRERLIMYSGLQDDFDLENFVVERLALNYDQVELWQPPENPAKETDARFAAYEAQFGSSSWELDAVEPRTLAQLVRDHVDQYRDVEAWEETVNQEQEWKDELQKLADNYR